MKKVPHPLSFCLAPPLLPPTTSTRVLLPSTGQLSSLVLENKTKYNTVLSIFQRKRRPIAFLLPPNVIFLIFIAEGDARGSDNCMECFGDLTLSEWNLREILSTKALFSFQKFSFYPITSNL
jgi:hypothetical protein